MLCDQKLTCALSSQAETRAEFAERSVAKLEKTIDDLEGTTFITCFLNILKCNQSRKRKHLYKVMQSIMHF